MDVRSWLIFIRDWLLVLLIGTAAAGAAAFVISSVLPKTYEAESLLLVGQSITSPNPDYTQLLASQVICQTYGAVGSARPNLERVVADLRLDTSPEELAASVDVRCPANSTLLVVTAQSTSPAEAAAIANSLKEVLLIGVEEDGIPNVTTADLEALDVAIATTTEDILALLGGGPLNATDQARLAQLQDQRTTLREERAEVLQQLTSAPNRLTLVEEAVIPTEPVSPRILLNTLLGAFIGLVITALVIYAFDSTERRSEAEVAAAAPPPMATPRFPTR